MPANPDLLVNRARRFESRVATIDVFGASSYGTLLERSARVAGWLLDGGTHLREARVAFLVAPTADWVAVQWGIWQAGGVAVPLATSHPPFELDYVLEDAGVSAVIADAEHVERMLPLARGRGIPLATLSELSSLPAGALPHVDPAGRALMVYTSGTTGRPKGVVTTHANIAAQVSTLVDAWEWSTEDHIVHVLPLHHVHGIINALSCALWAGARVEFLPRFDPELVWERLSSHDVTLFMAVPTVYHRLISAWDGARAEEKARWSQSTHRLRLMVSGSAALPVQTLERWRAITGHTLLERYGMTEIGMALSNPLHGERRAGSVGQPLPGVQVRLADDVGAPVAPGTPGEIEVRSAQVFLEYWNRPDETRAAFRNGWFVTGDVAVLENDYYRVLGRKSVDIIKTAGYKVSALEIEETLRSHPDVRDAAVVAGTDPDLGEKVCAAVVADDIEPEALIDWARQRLAPYKVPRAIRLIAELPRNAMGKVMKSELGKLFD
jgi:malonyl-CoA/methylmalonyl-CoA synthetase